MSQKFHRHEIEVAVSILRVQANNLTALHTRIDGTIKKNKSKIMAHASIVNSTRIEMFNRNNYDTWSIQVEVLLIKADLWEYVSNRKVKSEVHIERNNKQL